MKRQTFSLMLGYRCTARCRSCLWGDHLNSPEGIDVGQAKGWIDQAAALDICQRVGFSGGESFVYQREMRELASYAHDRYGSLAAASTKAFWARTPARAQAVLAPLRSAGLTELLLSADQFHQEFVPAQRIRTAISAALELGIHCTVQTIFTASSSRMDDMKAAIGFVDQQGVDWTEIPCTRTGWAATRLPPSDFPPRSDALTSYCSMLRLVVVRPDGGVFFCCGATFASPALEVGNLNREPLQVILERAEWDPLFNALALDNGPLAAARILTEDGGAAPTFSTSCEACQTLIGQPDAANRVRLVLEPQQAELFLKRSILDQSSPDSLQRMFGL